MSVLGTAVVDSHALLEVLWVALVAGVGVTGAFSLAILGFTRASDAAGGVRLGFAVMGVVALAISAGAVAYGVVLLTG